MTSFIPRWPGRGTEEELPHQSNRGCANRTSAEMGLTISSLFSRLFGKKQMRILMGERRRAPGRRSKRTGLPPLGLLRSGRTRWHSAQQKSIKLPASGAS